MHNQPPKDSNKAYEHLSREELIALLYDTSQANAELRADNERLSRAALKKDDQIRWFADRLGDAAIELTRHFGSQATSQQQIELIRQVAETDSLTGLPNRRAFDQELALRTQFDQPFIVFFIDLNNFKKINDTISHEKGDEVLQNVAKQITESLGISDAVGIGRRTGEDIDEDQRNNAYRVGGDEFIAVLELDSSEDAEQITQITTDALHDITSQMTNSDPVLSSMQFGLSIGSDVWRRGKNLKEVLRNADTAMYADKQRQGSRRKD